MDDASGSAAGGGRLFERLKPVAAGAYAEDSEARAILSDLEPDDAIDRAAWLAARDDVLVHQLLYRIFEGSSYLTGLIRFDPQRAARIITSDPEAYFSRLLEKLHADMGAVSTQDETAAMRLLRRFKSEVALLTAFADLGGVWPVMKVTSVLTETADAALVTAIRFLFRRAVDKGDWISDEGTHPDVGSGLIVLGMGKYGAGELNYSSDIDLIVFFEREMARLREGLEPQRFFVHLTRDLVRLIDERTADGYVFRTDLRLRPDAGATQLAISTDAALQYYESFGQNWERAALIKARPVAGDLASGESLLRELDPFVWRRYLDFAAIADVHAMKRQIHAFRKLGEIGVAGHNVKLGRGGIREIEFFVQTQQLIAGGRQRALRSRETLTTLDELVRREWIEPGVRDELKAAYLYLREIEHRIQMVADEQTHSLPKDPDRLQRFARFAGYADRESFAKAIVGVLETVQGHYAALFEDMPELTSRDVNMVFAGSDEDPDTVAALERMGFKSPGKAIEIVRSWHHGRYAAVRSERSRERLTEVQPILIEALGDTADPDSAILAFDRFLGELPAGIQLFSLLRANPNLLRLVADIMGTAPRLARLLSRRRRLLDAVIDPMTFEDLPSVEVLDRVISEELDRATDFQELLDRARIVGSEQWFLTGIRVLSGTIDASLAGEAYARIAESLIDALAGAVSTELVQSHGQVPQGAAVVLAMGKLGSREMSAGSDVDLIVIYDFEPGALESDGAKPLAPAQYFARFTQRLISALSAPTPEGTLYDVDMRLRPSGQQGPVATRFSSFREYQATEAWTWERMALTRARVISGPADLQEKVQAAIREALLRPSETEKIRADVREMRDRIAAEKGTKNIWDIKHVPGGLIDLEFIAQALQLIHAAERPEVLNVTTLSALEKLSEAGCLDPADAEKLLPAGRLFHDLTQILRICTEGPFEPASSPLGLRQLLTRASNESTFEGLEDRLTQAQHDVHAVFERLFPAQPSNDDSPPAAT